jgi:hypothetical protein
MPVTTRRQQAAVVGAGTQPTASRAHDDTSCHRAKEAEDAAKEHKFIEDVIGTGAERDWHACMADALCIFTRRVCELNVCDRMCMSCAEHASLSCEQQQHLNVTCTCR